MTGDASQILRALFETAVARVSASRCLPAHLPAAAPGRTIVVGAGKAAAAMARAFEQHYPGHAEGLVIVPDGHSVATSAIEVLCAGHPVPDQRSVCAGRRILELVADLDEGDRVICLLSGGGSALLCLPPDEVALDEKQALTNALLRCGAPISAINCVRAHLSQVKGGRLAVACYPASCLSLAISDVPGDDLALIASGPTIGDVTCRDDALAILARYGLADFRSVTAWLSDARSESPKPGDTRLARCEIRCVAKAADALAAAARQAESSGIEPSVLGDDLEGDARELARTHAARISAMIAQYSKPSRPRVLLSGGETTVNVTGRGRGGRNSEYLLALALSLAGQPGVHALACDTDGIDGSGHNAGAVISPDSVARAAALGIDAQQRLDDNDAFGFFEALGALVVSGPTFTNVNDFRAILILPEAWDFKREPRL